MKITEFNTEYIEEKDRLGLKAFKMSKLGNVVLLAGKNGSGKSRVLRLLHGQCQHRRDYLNERRDLPRVIMNTDNRILQYVAHYNQLMQDPQRKNDAEELKKQVVDLKNQRQGFEKKLNAPFSINIDLPENQNIKIVNYVPKSTQLTGTHELRQYEQKAKAQSANNLGCNQLADAAISLIQDVYDQYWNTSHPEFDGEEAEKITAKENFDRLQEIINRFIGAKLSRNKDGVATIYDKPIAQAQLSEGQIILLQLCIAIYAQGAKISDYILVMDEPENHLHPSAVIEMIDKIRELNPEGQIWIATHSIALLSHFDPSCIWYVKDGTVSYSGRKPEQVLEGLLGNEENIQRLHSFIDLPDEFAANRFAFECLLPPGVVESDSSDPQFLQFKSILESIWAGGKEKISLLDYGAGKGRMIANLSEDSRINPEKIDYVAYDDCSANRETCISNIGNFYPDASNRYFNQLDTLRTRRDDGSFDVVLMCNVLHEIPHTEWKSIFEDLKRLLKDDGKLLIIEDCKIPVGELPHQKGFVVFETIHLKDLFNISASDNLLVAHDARPDKDPGRLMAHLIPATYLDKITPESKKKAFKDLRETALTNIKNIRTQERTYKNGLTHAFWVQQLANATLCLEEM